MAKTIIEKVKRALQTRDLVAKTPEDRGIVFGPVGPQTSELRDIAVRHGDESDPASAIRYLSRRGRPEELIRFAKELTALRAKDEPKFIYRQCDNPDCLDKHTALRTVVRDLPDEKGIIRPEGGTCTRCNWGIDGKGYVEGGHMKNMSSGEIKTHLKNLAAIDARNNERRRQAAYYAENERHMKAGLPSETIDQMEVRHAEARKINLANKAAYQKADQARREETK